jgi:dienelactone hydrolase
MLAGLLKLVDWTAMQMAAASMPQPDGRNPRLLEARKLIDWPDFFPSKVEAADVQFTGKVRFAFETPCPGLYEENNIVHGRLFRCGQDWQQRPTVLLLHGWNDVIDHRVRFPGMARQFNRSGLNAATLEAPFHFQRRPRQLGAWSNFLCPDILRTVEAVRQAVQEIRAFSQWLRQQGCPAVGLLGVSLGGWLAGLAVCHEARFACAVLLVPAASMDRLMEDAPFFRGIRLALNGQPIQAGRLNLMQARPVIPKENILLIESVHDLFVPVETMEQLWRHWDQPEIWRLGHGHISVLVAPGLCGRIIDWMAPRLNRNHAAGI